MQTPNLIDTKLEQDNKQFNEQSLRGAPCFVTIQNDLNRNIQIRIPCSNKSIAMKILTSVQGQQAAKKLLTK